jgi:Protein of unknown function (DUF3768)
MKSEKAAEIARLNDHLRKTFQGGMVNATIGIKDVPEPARQNVFAAVREFDAFNDDNDPHGEHDGAMIDVDGLTVFFKIDYFDLALKYHSEDPADPAKTTRVMTIMLADEY